MSATTKKTQRKDRTDVALIEPRLLLPPSINSRRTYDRAYQAALAEDISRNKLELPVMVTPEGDAEGRYRVIEGWNRVEAHRLLGAAAVPCEILESVSLKDQALLNFRVNWRRQNLCELEVGLFLAECLEADLFKATEIPSLLGQDFSGNLTKLLCYGKLPAQVVEVMLPAKEKFKASVAYELLLFYQDACDVMFDAESALEATIELARKCAAVRNPTAAISARRAFFSSRIPDRPERISVKLADGRVTLSRDSKGFVRLSGRLGAEGFERVKCLIEEMASGPDIKT